MLQKRSAETKGIDDGTMELPDDIVIQILRRLPVKSLVRFKSVSKFWNSTISDPRFVRSHTHTTDSTQSTKLIINKRYIYTMNLQNYKFGASVMSLDDYFPTRRNGILKIIDTCDGLICALLEKDDFAIWNPKDDFVILNPTTREYRYLPRPPPCPFRNKSSFPGVDNDGLLCGFGYDKISDDYKVIKCEMHLYFDDDGFLKSHYMVSVFSLKSNCWRGIHDQPRGFRFEYCGGTYVDGHIYWAVTSENHWRPRDPILSFSISNEKFETASWPVDPHIIRNFELGKLDGRLCAGLTRCGFLQMWTLKKSDESIDCWTPLLAWRFPSGLSSFFSVSSFVPLARTTSGGILVLFKRGIDTQLLVFNHMNNESVNNPIRVPDNPAFHIFVSTYVESLTSPYPLGK